MHDDATPVPIQPRYPHEIRAVAVRAHRDPRTVIAAYAGRATPIAAAAIAAAAAELGYAPPPRPGVAG